MDNRFRMSKIGEGEEWSPLAFLDTKT